MEYITAQLSGELEYIDLYVVSDIHRGHCMFNKKAWDTLIDKIKNDPHAFMIINGDGVEAATKKSKHGDVYRSMAPKEERLALQNELEPVKEKVLLIQPGNHEERHSDSDENPLELVATMLGIRKRYAPISSILEVSFGSHNGTKDKRTSFMFYVTHGRGGGRRPGAKMNRIQELAFVVDGVDGYVMGHVHDLMSHIEGRKRPDPHNKKCVEEPVAYVVAGSFLDYGDYAEAGGYAPNAVSMPILRLFEKKRHDKHKHIEVILPTRIRTA